MTRNLSTILLCALCAAGILYSCSMGGGDTSPASSTGPRLTVQVLSGDNPVSGVELSVGGVTFGTTDGDGVYTMAYSENGNLTIRADKKFFLSGEESLSLTGDDESVTIRIEPKIIFPDMLNKRIVYMDNMAGDNKGYIESVPGKNGTVDLGYVNWVDVDYDNGYIYILDSICDTSGYVDSSRIIRLSDLEDPETIITPLTDQVLTCGGACSDKIIFPSQLALTDSGEILIAEISLEMNASEYVRLVKMSDIKSFEDCIVTFVRDQDDYKYSSNNGIAILPGGGSLISSCDEGRTHDSSLSVIGDFDGSMRSDWGGVIFSEVAGENSFDMPSSILVDSVNGFVYVSDSGDLPNPGDAIKISDSNNRIARFDLGGDNRINRGTGGSGTMEFNHPRLVAILPDNRLIIEDIGNNRLVALKSTRDGLENWEEEADSSNHYCFYYWYNAS